MDTEVSSVIDDEDVECLHSNVARCEAEKWWKYNLNLMIMLHSEIPTTPEVHSYGIRNKQVDFFGRQKGLNYLSDKLGTIRLGFLRDKQVDLFEGQIGGPSWGTNRVTFLRHKEVKLFEGQPVCPYLGTNRFILLRNKKVDLSDFLWTNRLTFWRTKWLNYLSDLIEGQTGWHFWKTNRLT